jgi:hypothetical protein
MFFEYSGIDNQPAIIHKSIKTWQIVANLYNRFGKGGKGKREILILPLS